MGRLNFMQKRYGPAVELLQRAVANDASLLEAHYYLGLTYSRIGRKPESDAELQKAAELQHKESENRKALWNRLDLPAASSQQ
jgi:Flp pilus assembly protein TadD